MYFVLTEFVIFVFKYLHDTKKDDPDSNIYYGDNHTCSDYYVVSQEENLFILCFIKIILNYSKSFIKILS